MPLYIRKVSPFWAFKWHSHMRVEDMPEWLGIAFKEGILVEIFVDFKDNRWDSRYVEPNNFSVESVTVFKHELDDPEPNYITEFCKDGDYICMQKGGIVFVDGKVFESKYERVDG